MTLPSGRGAWKRCSAVALTMVAALIAAASVSRIVGAQPGTSSTPSVVQGAPRRESFDELYERGQRANAAMKTLTARFTETTTSPLLTRPLVSHGRLAVERPARVILRYTDPESRTVLIDGNRMTLTWPVRQLRQVTDITTAQGRVQKYFINGTAAQLRGQFDIEEHDTSDRPGTAYVTLTPKRKQIREALTRLEVWVSRSSMLMDAMKMTFANGDTKLMTFADVVPNAPIEAGTFTEAPPPRPPSH